eukprot:m51a1_g3963 hypothetical protein (175) ;mRNA; r:376996-377924
MAYYAGGPGMYGAPMMGAPMMAPGYGCPIPGYTGGYPVWSQPLMDGMYYKPIWTPKREMKLQKVYYECVRDGIITFNEVMYILHKFHYTTITQMDAQWFFYTLDRNRDGRIDYCELSMAMQEFVVRYPRMRNPCKTFMKPHYTYGYNWMSSPYFPQTYGSLWTSHHMSHHHHHW